MNGKNCIGLIYSNSYDKALPQLADCVLWDRFLSASLSSYRFRFQIW